jgi:hypothetical protein
LEIRSSKSRICHLSSDICFLTADICQVISGFWYGNCFSLSLENDHTILRDRASANEWNI